MTSTALAGVRVIELGEVFAGPLGGSFLGDFGADVIKVESYPRLAGITRPLGAFGPGMAPGDGPPWERSATHHGVNRNKRNLALDLSRREGAEVMRRLVERSDILLASYSAGTLDRLGFGWDAAHELNPRLVMIEMPGWGLEGPYRKFVTFGSGLDATCGHTAVRGYPDATPANDVRAPVHTDAIGALHVVQAAVVGLMQRDGTGQGSHIDMSQLEAFAWHLAGPLAEWTMNGRHPPRLGNADPTMSPHGVYRCRGDDRWVAVAVPDDAAWRGLAAALEHPEWAARGHPWATIVGRLRARAEVDAALGEWTTQREADDVAEQLQAERVPAAAVMDASRILADPQLQARNWFNLVEHPAVGTQFLPGFPVRVSPDHLAVDRRTGLVGEHNHEVLSSLLGYSDDEIAELERTNVLGSGYEHLLA